MKANKAVSKSDWRRVKEDARLDRVIPFDPATDPYNPNDPAAVEAFTKQATVSVRKLGRPTVAVRRPALTMRIDPDLLEHLRASGKGWQSRLHQIIQDAVHKGKI